MSKEKQSRPKQWFEVLRGIHREGNKTYAPDILERDGTQLQYKDGKYIYTSSNLLALNPQPGIGPQRFRLLNPGEAEVLGLDLPEGEEAPDPNDPRILLGKQSIAYLRSLAGKEEIDLEGEKRKSVIIDKIIAGREERAAAVGG